MLKQNISISQRGQEIIVTILIAASVLFIGADYLYSLPGYQQIGIYIFDLVVVVILAKEFYSRMKRLNEQKIKIPSLVFWSLSSTNIPVVSSSALEFYNQDRISFLLLLVD